MIRGTTDVFKFKIPYNLSDLSWATIKFWQPNNPSRLLPITKTLKSCAISDNPNELCVSLTAEETSRFLDIYKAKVQMRAQDSVSGTVFGCSPQNITVYPMDDGIIAENPMLPPETEDGFIILDGQVISS